MKFLHSSKLLAITAAATAAGITTASADSVPLSADITMESSSLRSPLIIGEDLCSCTPHVYEFKLDFTSTCNDMEAIADRSTSSSSSASPSTTRRLSSPRTGATSTATTRDERTVLPIMEDNFGLDGHACVVGPFGEENRAGDDLVPDTIHAVTFTELDRNLNVLTQETHESLYMQHGDILTYESFSNTPEEIDSVADLPRALQINVVGTNQHGEGVTNVALITFTNDCTFFPVVQPRHTVGWLTVTSVVDPIPQLCPAAPAIKPRASKPPHPRRHHHRTHNEFDEHPAASAPTRDMHRQSQ